MTRLRKIYVDGVKGHEEVPGEVEEKFVKDYSFGMRDLRYVPEVKPEEEGKDGL